MDGQVTMRKKHEMRIKTMQAHTLPKQNQKIKDHVFPGAKINTKAKYQNIFSCLNA